MITPPAPKPLIRYGSGYVQERRDWLAEHPIGPVHWDVLDAARKPIGADIPASELQCFMVSHDLLALW